MPLSRLDEYLTHQFPEPVDTVYTPDRNFYDRYYFNLHGPGDELFLVTGLGQYPNLGVTDAFVTVAHDDVQTTVRASRELGSDRLGRGQVARSARAQRQEAKRPRTFRLHLRLAGLCVTGALRGHRAGGGGRGARR